MKPFLALLMVVERTGPRLAFLPLPLDIEIDESFIGESFGV
jgi:hypothetical protein